MQRTRIGCEEPGALRGVRPIGQPAGAARAADDGDSECYRWQNPREPAARRRLRRRGVQPCCDGSLQHLWQWYDDHRQGEEPDEFRGRAEPSNDEWRPHGDVRQQDGPPLHDGPGAWPGAGATTRRRPRRPRPTGVWFVYNSDDRQVRAAIFEPGMALASL